MDKDTLDLLLEILYIIKYDGHFNDVEAVVDVLKKNGVSEATIAKLYKF